MEDKLPRYTQKQKIGNRSASILKSVMQKFCIFSNLEQEQDIGIDFIGTVLKDEFPTEYNFNAQCKGTNDIDIKLNAEGTIFSYPIKVKTINYWKQKKDTTFLFLVDEKEEEIYWSAALNEIENRDLSNQDTYTFHISKENCFNSKSTSLPEDFVFEIIRYYANFSESIIRQFDKIEEYSSDSHSSENMLTLMEILESNFNRAEEKYRCTINKLIEKIKFDLNRSLDYCYTLDQMDDIVRQYCPRGVFYTPFGTGNGLKNIRECELRIEELISRKNATYKELFDLSKEISELRGNLLGFLREMVYEDMPDSNHDDVDKEFNEWLKEVGKL